MQMDFILKITKCPQQLQTSSVSFRENEAKEQGSKGQKNLPRISPNESCWHLFDYSYLYKNLGKYRFCTKDEKENEYQVDNLVLALPNHFF